MDAKELFAGFAEFLNRKNLKDFVINYHDNTGEVKRQKLKNKVIAPLFEDFIAIYPTSDDSIRKFRTELLKYKDANIEWTHIVEESKKGSLVGRSFIVDSETLICKCLDVEARIISFTKITQPKKSKPNQHLVKIIFTGEAFRFMFHDGYICETFCLTVRLL